MPPILFIEYQYYWTWAQILAKIKLQKRNIGQRPIRLDMFRPSVPQELLLVNQNFHLLHYYSK